MAIEAVKKPVFNDPVRNKTNIIRKIGVRLNDYFVEDDWGMRGYLTIAIIICTFFVITAISIGKVESLSLKDILLNKIFWIPATAMFLTCAAFIVYVKQLRCYGIQNNQLVWLIDYREERILSAEMIKVVTPCEYFNGTVFSVNRRGRKIVLLGEDIYFSEDDATRMLLYVQNYNDREISQYYPEWKKDRDFVNYYNDVHGDYKHRGRGARYVMYNCGSNSAFNTLCDGKEIVKQYIQHLKDMNETKKRDEKEAAEREDLINQIKKLKQEKQ